MSVEQLRTRLLNARGFPGEYALCQLEKDSRQGVRALAQTLRRRRDRQKRERQRVSGLRAEERSLRRTGIRRIAGVDEVGVGPLAGPVVAAAVVFQPATVIYGINDSKQLGEGSRHKLDGEIRRQAECVGVGVASVEEIARLNVYRAGLLAMERAVAHLQRAPELLLVDGRSIPGCPTPQQRIVGGDRTVFSIAAASIVAKVYRDNLMLDLDRRFPQYGFAAHKGYATLRHRRAIRKHGPCNEHRQSYAAVQALTPRNNLF